MRAILSAECGAVLFSLVLLLSLAACGEEADGLAGRVGVLRVPDPVYWEAAEPALKRAAALHAHDLVLREAPADAEAYLAALEALAEEDLTALVLAPPDLSGVDPARLERVFSELPTVVLERVPDPVRPLAIVKTPWPAVGRKAVSLTLSDLEGGELLLVQAAREEIVKGVRAAREWLAPRGVATRVVETPDAVTTAVEAGARAVVALDPTRSEVVLEALEAVRTDGPRPFVVLCGDTPRLVRALEEERIDWLLVPDWGRVANDAIEILAAPRERRKDYLREGLRIVEPLYVEPASVGVLRRHLAERAGG